MPATHLDWSNVEACAKELAGNHFKFQCFAYWDRPEDGERWAVVYTHNRDSGLLDQSNAAAVEELLKTFLAHGTVVAERHSHWLCGWVDGYRILVYTKSRKITKAFRAYCELRARLEDYPVLDEEDYSRREYEATLENIQDAGRRFVSDDAPEDWPSQCFSWFWDHDQGAVESRDDQGGYPSDEEIKECLRALGFLDPDYLEDESE